MIIYITGIIAGLVPVTGLPGQENPAAINSESSFFQTIRANQRDSYITLGGGLGNMDPLIFEARIAPYFLLRTSDDSRWGATLSPEIILRMYAEES